MPTLRHMTNDDLLAYKQLCTICYGYADTNVPEPLDEAALHIRMGVFSDDGRLLSAMMQIPYTVRFNGQDTKLVGIGGVVTDPVARRGGAIRQMFEEGLPRLYHEGHVFSALYPFSFRFYGKFGYTWAEMWQNRAVRTADVRRDLQKADEIVRVLPDMADDQGMAQVYAAYIADKELAFHRDAWMWKDVRKGTPWGDLTHAYVLKIGGRAAAYWVGQVVKGAETTLRIRDMAWSTPRGRDAIFAMLRDMNEVQVIEMSCRGGFDLRSMVEEAYDVEEKGSAPGMVRVVNAEKALALLTAPPVTGALTLDVADGQISENNGRFTVTSDGEHLTVSRAPDAEPDVACDIRGLSALVAGRQPFNRLLEQNEVQLLHANKMCFADMLFPTRRLHVNHNF